MGITLKEYLELNKDNKELNRICLMEFDGDSVESKEYDRQRFIKIKDEDLVKEVMDLVQEDDLMEVWVM